MRSPAATQYHHQWRPFKASRSSAAKIRPKALLRAADVRGVRCTATAGFPEAAPPAASCSATPTIETFFDFRAEGKNQLTGSKRSKNIAASRTMTTAANIQPTRRRIIWLVHGTPCQRNVSTILAGALAMVSEKLSL